MVQTARWDVRQCAHHVLIFGCVRSEYISNAAEATHRTRGTLAVSPFAFLKTG